MGQENSVPRHFVQRASAGTLPEAAPGVDGQEDGPGAAAPGGGGVAGGGGGLEVEETGVIPEAPHPRYVYEIVVFLSRSKTAILSKLSAKISFFGRS